MPARNPGLPEGTDQIINGAMETGAGTTASTGSTGGGGGGGASGGGAAGGTGGTSGFVASGGGGNDTGGTVAGGGTSLAAAPAAAAAGAATPATSQSGSGSAVGGAAEKLVGQVREQVTALRSQATDKVHQFADTGKERVTSALDNITEIINDAARSVDARLGDQYGQYAHRAADAVSSFTQSLRGKSVDELVDDTRSAVRKSPGIAIGTAAVLGFALMRVVKAGMPTDGGGTGNAGGSGQAGGGAGGGTTGAGG